MAEHTPVEPTEKQISEAADMWGRFTWIMSVSIAACIAALLVLTVIFFSVFR